MHHVIFIQTVSYIRVLGTEGKQRVRTDKI